MTDIPDTPATPPKRGRGRPKGSVTRPAIGPSAEEAAIIARRGLRRSDLDPLKPANLPVVRDVVAELGESRIADALEFAAAGNEDSPAHALWARMHDPEFRSLSIARNMRESGLTIVDILTMVRSRDIALGLADSGKHIAGILDDMGRESRSKMVPCEHCYADRRDAARLLADGIDVGDVAECQWCGSAGVVMVPGVQESRKIFLKAQGVLKDGSGGVNVAVVNNPPPAPASGPEPITARIQRILDSPTGPDDAIEADLVEGK